MTRPVGASVWCRRPGAFLFHVAIPVIIHDFGMLLVLAIKYTSTGRKQMKPSRISAALVLATHAFIALAPRVT